MKPLTPKFLFIETYCSGSHELFARGLAENSCCRFDIVQMPGENYRWRMLGSALYLLEHLPPLETYDGIIVTDLFNLADFKALYRGKLPPVMVYFHENQLTYPAPPGDKSVFQLGMINITTALAADTVVFNSKTHRNAFLEAIPQFLKRGSDCIPGHVKTKIDKKSYVLYPGISLPAYHEVDAQKQITPPLIVWNHRWGFDKNGEAFFRVVEKIDSAGLDFQLAVMGENFGKIPEAFKKAEKDFKKKIVSFGYVPFRKNYIKWLKRGTYVVSTSQQENFGISMVEAMLMKCIPFMPDRLCYPEILPEQYHKYLLYKNEDDLTEKLASALCDHELYQKRGRGLFKEMEKFLWHRMIKAYDTKLKQFSKSGPMTY